MMPGCSRLFTDIRSKLRCPDALTLNEVWQLMLRASGKDYAKAGLI